MATTTGTRIFKDGWNFFAGNFWGVMGAAAVPALVLILAALAAYQVQTQILTQQLQQGVPADKLNPFSAKLLLVYFVSAISSLWFTVRIYRFRLRSEFPVTSSEFTSILWLLLYYVALFFIYMLVVIALVFAGVVVIMIAAAAMGLTPETLQSDPRMLRILGAGLILVVIPFYFYVAYAAMRFFIAFPGIALGRRDSMFRVMWPMARGVTLPLLLWFVLVGVVWVAFSGIVIWQTGGVAVMFPTLVPDEGFNKLLNDPQGVFRYQLIMGFLLMIPGVIVRAFAATVLAEGYAQLNRPKLDVFA
jgi:hypothetical protein